MLNLVTSSKDRPMQLLAFLDSVVINTRGFFNSSSVIYLATNNDYKKGYELVKSKHPYVKFIEQGDYKTDMMGELKHDYTCLATDDDIIYKEVNKRYRDYMIDDSIIAFSLRLGTNINYCYPLDKPNTLNKYEDCGDTIKWDWTAEQYDFAYPLSVTGHIFRTHQLNEWSSQIEFNNPNQHEAQLQRFIQDIVLSQPKIVSYKESKMFGVPANRVNTSNNNRNGLKYPYTTEELNNRLFRGESIDVANLNYGNVNAAQYELEYKFKHE